MGKGREVLVLTGNYAAAHAALDAKVEIVAIYPITPQTTIVERIEEFVAKGLLKAQIIRVDSEHSAFGAAIGASAVGARAYTATSSHGLLYAYENIWWASNARLPIVANFVTRTIGPPWNIWSDHQDFLTMRDTGWILFMAKNAQEVYDLTLMSFKIAEDPDVRLPVGVGLDAFLISHTSEPVEVLNDEADEILPSPRRIVPLLDPANPYSVGNLPKADENYALKKNIWDCIVESRSTIKKVLAEYTEFTGRDYKGIIDCYMCDDADVVMISLGAMSEEGMNAVDFLREKGHKVGHINLRLIRPFPSDELAKALNGVKDVIVFSRGVSMGKAGAIYDDVVSALYRYGLYPRVYDVVAGLAGAEVSMKDYIRVFNDVNRGLLKMQNTYYVLNGEYYV